MCVALKLVYVSALFKTFIHVYVRTMYDQICSARKKENYPPLRSGLGMDMQNMCAKIQGLSLKNGVNILTYVGETHVLYVVACNYLILA